MKILGIFLVLITSSFACTNNNCIACVRNGCAYVITNERNECVQRGIISPRLRMKIMKISDCPRDTTFMTNPTPQHSSGSGPKPPVLPTPQIPSFLEDNGLTIPSTSERKEETTAPVSLPQQKTLLPQTTNLYEPGTEETTSSPSLSHASEDFEKLTSNQNPTTVLPFHIFLNSLQVPKGNYDYMQRLLKCFELVHLQMWLHQERKHSDLTDEIIDKRVDKCLKLTN